MIEIIQKSRELTKREEFKATKTQSPILIKDIEDGTKITPNFWVVYTDVEKDTEVLSIVDVDGNVYTTISKTFKDNFLDMASIFAGEEFALVKISGTTKAGRPFVNCDLAD